MRAALVAIGLLAGCRFDGGLGTGLLCPTGECPAGQACIEGVCSIGGGETDAAPDRDATQDAGMADAGGGDPTNMVLNPGMEDGTDPWIAYNGVRGSTGEPHAGNLAMLVCATTDPDFTLYQDVLDPPEPVVKGAVYSASVWVRAEPAEPEPGLVRLTIRERGGAAPLLDHDSIDVPLAGTEWIQLQVSASIQEPDRTTVIFIVWGLSAQAGDCFAADDAVMHEE